MSFPIWPFYFVDLELVVYGCLMSILDCKCIIDWLGDASMMCKLVCVFIWLFNNLDFESGFPAKICNPLLILHGSVSTYTLILVRRFLMKISSVSHFVWFQLQFSLCVNRIECKMSRMVVWLVLFWIIIHWRDSNFT